MIRLKQTSAAFLLAAGLACAAEFPETSISAKGIEAKFYLPDAERGYYRGTRFDWSGQMPSLRALNHDYFGKWFEKYDPKLHDAIEGPVEEFVSAENTSVGYNEAKVGETFIRIGVGAVKKPEERPYARFKTYEIVDPGKWTVKSGKDRVSFTHRLANNGYAYTYTKTVRVSGGANPQMVIEHSLKNTGKKPIETMQYNHNFFVIDGQPTGAAASVNFPFDLQPKTPLKPELAGIEKGRISYKRDLAAGETVQSEMMGFGDSAKDYDVRVENSKAGVRVQGDQPIKKIIYWSIRSTFCPEAYVDVSVPPGKEKTWKYTYSFYEVK